MIWPKEVAENPKKSKPVTQLHWNVAPDVPVNDFFKYVDLDDPSDIDQAINFLIDNIESGYYLQWEAVMHQEQGLPLTKKQNKALDSLLYFNDEDEDRILYIDEVPRPKEPWYEIARKIVPRIIEEPFKTDAGMHPAIYEGWPMLVEVLEAHGRDLSLPPEVNNPLAIFPASLWHRLWLQVCFDALSGLGQDDELTLANPEQREYRIEWFLKCFKEHKDTVQYLDLSLVTLLTKVIMPPNDEEIFVRLMTEQLGLPSSQARLAKFL
jgi:hypothetical protein